MPLKVVFNQSTGNIEITSLSDPVLDTILKITDPQGVVIHQNAGFGAVSYASPDLTSAANSFTVAIPNVGATDVVGAYTIEYHENDLVDDPAESMTATYEPKKVKLCIEYTVSCVCSKIDLEDVTSYETLPTSRAWTVDYPSASGVAQVTGTAKTLQVGPNIWTGAHDVYLTSLVETTNETNVSTITKNTQYVSVVVDCSTKSSIYGLLKGIYDKYYSMSKRNPREAQAYLKTLQEASVIAQLADLAEAKGSHKEYQSFLTKLRAMAVSCGCDDCEDCDDKNVYEVQPSC